MKLKYTYVEFDFSDTDDEITIDTVAEAYNEILGKVYEFDIEDYLDEEGNLDAEDSMLDDEIVNNISDVTGWCVIDSDWEVLEDETNLYKKSR